MGNQSSASLGKSEALRAEADALYKSRNAAFHESQQAYKRGDHATSKKKSEEGKRLDAQAKRKSEQAAHEIFSQSNHGRQPTEVDLHGLFVAEALAKVEERIKMAKKPESKIRAITFFVGKGLHSANGDAKIKPAVMAMVNRMGDTPGKKARKAAQAAQAAREQQENVGAASAEAKEPAGEPAAGMDPAQQQPIADPPADPNRALEAGLAALSGTVCDLQARVDQVESGCATQHDLSNTLHAVREQGNELDKLATKVNSAQNTMKGHARELGGLQSGVADVQARTVKPDQLREVAEAVAKAQDACMMPFIKQVISQELTSTMGALQTFMIDNLLKQQPQPAPAPGPSEPAAPAAYTADSSDVESDKEGKKGKGVNAKGKHYATAKAAAQAAADKEKLKGSHKRKHGGEKVVPVSEDMVKAMVQAAMAEANKAKKKKKNADQQGE